MNDMSRAELGTREIQKRMEESPVATNINRAADATALGRLKNLIPEKARHALRTSAQKAALTASGLYLLISSGCGNIENPIVPAPSKEPSPISASLVPTETQDNVKVTIIRAPTPTPTREPDTEGVTVKIIKAPTLSLEPTKAPTPEATLIAPPPTVEVLPTPTPSSTMSSEQELNPVSAKTHETAETISLESKIINGMETYGDDKSLTQSELLKLYEKLNSVEQEMRDNTYYGTIFVAKTAYDNLPRSVENDTFQKFIKRHEDFFNQMVNKQPYPGTNKLSIRRLVVVEDGLGTPHFFLNEFVKDSDGGWNIESTYTPTQAAYYDKSLQIDYGLLHELGHAIFHLPDQYPLDFSSEDMLPDSIADNTPSQWRSYKASDRNDIGRNLMGNIMGDFRSGPTKQIDAIGLHANLQLLRRMLQKDVHDSKKTGPEVLWNFPYEIPEKTTFVFGGDYANATVDIFRSTEVDVDKRPSQYSRKKKLELTGNYVNSENGNLTLTKDKLFPFSNNENNLIKAEDSTLLLRMTKDGKNYFRWMDIRDFNIPYWLGNKEHVNMNLQLATEKDNPETFPWRIIYSNGSPASP